MSLSKKYRPVYADRAGGFGRTFIQLTTRLFEVIDHRPGIADKQMPAFRGDHRPGIAIEQLLAERVLKLMNNARHLRGRDSLSSRDDGKVLRFIDGNKQQQ